MHSAAATASSAQWPPASGYGTRQEARSDAAPPAGDGKVTCVSARELFELVAESRSKPSPDADDVFPWLYGISPQNETGASFLRLRYPGADVAALLAAPRTNAGVLFVKYGDPGDAHPSIRGSVPVQDVLTMSPDGSRYVGEFVETDLVEGLQLRNFAIQAAKFARICDIVVYSAQPHASTDDRDELVPVGIVLAELISDAQAKVGLGRRTYFFPGDFSAAAMRELTPDLAQSLIVGPKPVDDYGVSLEPEAVDWENGLAVHEQHGIVGASAVSEVLKHVWVGNTVSMAKAMVAREAATPRARGVPEWRTRLGCEVDAQVPTLPTLDHLIRQSRRRGGMDESLSLFVPRITTFADPMVNIYNAAVMLSLLKLLFVRSKRHATVIMSADGYHVSSPFVALYVMYATGKPLVDALLYLHTECKRPLSFTSEEFEATDWMAWFVYEFSPVRNPARTRGLGAVPIIATRRAFDPFPLPTYFPPAWFQSFPGAFPSRVLEHLYLGAFEHANLPEMLRALGIQRVLSIGEKLDWLEYPIQAAAVQERGFAAVRHVDGLQDDGVDSLLPRLPACLEFLADAQRLGHKTLVHCRKGVSRSAAVCIAEVMRANGWGLPQAYAHVRIHRLDVIIQPNMRLMYDLLKFEEQAPFLPGRTVDWPVLSREIAQLNEL